MLTLEINDARLEQKILEKARSIGKTVQELLNDFVVEKIQEEEKEEKLPFDVPKLDYRNYIKIIDYEIENEDEIDDKPIFQNGIQTAEFARQLRQEGWKRKS
jgi:uncharacterized protein YjbK